MVGNQHWPDNLGLLEWERDTTAAELEAEALDRAINGKLGHGYGMTASLKLVGLQLQMLGTEADEWDTLALQTLGE
jgi:hypothetical protein